MVLIDHLPIGVKDSTWWVFWYLLQGKTSPCHWRRAADGSYLKAEAPCDRARILSLGLYLMDSFLVRIVKICSVMRIFSVAGSKLGRPVQRCESHKMLTFCV